MGTDANSFDPVFYRKVERVLAGLRSKGWNPMIVPRTGGYRSLEQQAALKGSGKGVTQVSVGYHNNVDPVSGAPRALAADVVDRTSLWNTDERGMRFFRDLGALAKAQGLGWGGDWRSFKDYPHIQTRRFSMADVRQNVRAAEERRSGGATVGELAPAAPETEPSQPSSDPTSSTVSVSSSPTSTQPSATPAPPSSWLQVLGQWLSSFWSLFAQGNDANVRKWTSRPH